MMTQAEIRVTSIGHIAHQVLRRTPVGLVTGTTSQGIYLQPGGDLTLYLTYDLFRGPLTINLRDARDTLPTIETGDVVILMGEEISFIDSDQVIQVDHPLVWKPASPPRYQKQPANWFAELKTRARKLHPEHPYLPLLEIVTTGEPILIKDIPGIEHQLIHLSKSLGSGNLSDILSGMKSILGAGPGLTPLGDDLLLGVLLAITRTQSQTYWAGDVIRFYHTVISAAEEKTTTLSWSLLNCAIQGSADERIIRVLDGLIAAREVSDRDLVSLMAWGSSSGIAVLAGMIMALSS